MKENCCLTDAGTYVTEPLSWWGRIFGCLFLERNVLGALNGGSFREHFLHLQPPGRLFSSLDIHLLVEESLPPAITVTNMYISTQ